MVRESEVIKFHKGCKEEYNELLNHFNILFYGYGCKKRLLQFLFPAGILIDCRLYSLQEILEEIQKDTSVLECIPALKRHKKRNLCLELDQLDELCEKNSIKITILFLHFNFKQLSPFRKAQNFKIVGTVEKVSYGFGFQELEAFNFIFRDLTTFIPYYEDISGINLTENTGSVEGMINVYENVPKKSKFMFLELLKLRKDSKKVYLLDIYNTLKKTLLLRNKNECLTLLSEFIDHNLMKVRPSGEIVLEFKNSEIHSFLEKCSS